VISPDDFEAFIVAGERIEMGRAERVALVTGATGQVGFNIVEALRRRGAKIRCLARVPDRARALLGDDVDIVRGDLAEEASIDQAMHGCSVVYHAAGLPEQWVADRRIFERLNVDGTRRMVAAALVHGVERFVFTSTTDVFAAKGGEAFDETAIDPKPKATAYQRSKQTADRLVADAVACGLPAVFVHPSAVYGPAPLASRGLNDLFANLRDGKIPLLLPGGLPIVYAPDVGEGHVLAAEKGETGGRFILSDAYFTLEDIARHVAEVAGLKTVPRVIPLWGGELVAGVGALVSKFTRRPPLIPKGQLNLLQWGAKPIATRAKEELGWPMTPFTDGVRRTMAFLEHGETRRPTIR